MVTTPESDDDSEVELQKVVRGTKDTAINDDEVGDRSDGDFDSDEFGSDKSDEFGLDKDDEFGLDNDNLTEFGFDETHQDCPDCVAGSGRKVGHIGRHTRTVARDTSLSK